jgi:hypothetical protein
MDQTIEHGLNPEGEAAREALEITKPGQAKRRAMWRRLAGSRYAWAFAGVVLALVVVTAAIRQSQSSAGLGEDIVATSTGLSGFAAARDERAAEELRQETAAISSNLDARPAPAESAESSDSSGAEQSETKAVTGPIIAQTASLTIVPANYDRAAGSIDALVAAYGGYVQKLDSESRQDASREVSLTLRVPVKQMDTFLADVRKLGRVEEESRENEEVTDQYVDLDARLQSARAGEQRLLGLLQTRTGKLEDVLDAEHELTRMQGEIESMTGERNVLVHRVEYATVELQLQEQYRAQFGSGTPAGSLRNALVEGFRNLEAGAITALAFVLTYGPSILFWLVIFGAPAWLVWRVARRKFVTPQ